MIILTDAEPRETRSPLQVPEWLQRETAELMRRRLRESLAVYRSFAPRLYDAYDRRLEDNFQPGDTIRVGSTV